MDIKCSFWSENSCCSSVGIGSSVCPLLSCSHDVGSHLVSLGVGTKRGVIGAVVTEIDLILNRAGLFGTTLEEKQVMTVCPKHRKTLTIDWMGRKIKTCCYPNHTGQKKGNLLLRRANAEMSEEIFNQYDAVVPIGSGRIMLSLTFD